MSLINRLLSVFRRDVGAPVHAGANPIYYTYVYELEDGFWVFAWHDTEHRLGAVGKPTYSQELAERQRKFFEETKSYTERASFVRA
jgi:hypothetical protein